MNDAYQNKKRQQCNELIINNYCLLIMNVTNGCVFPASLHNERVHALGVSVEIELKMDWQRCKHFQYFKALRISFGGINTELTLC